MEAYRYVRNVEVSVGRRGTRPDERIREIWVHSHKRCNGILSDNKASMSLGVSSRSFK